MVGEPHKAMGKYCKIGESMNMKCWICGEPATVTKQELVWGSMVQKPLNEYSRCYCEKCYIERSKQITEEHATLTKLRKREMLRKACDKLEKQNTNMYEYKEAIEVVSDFVEANIDKIDSSYEALTAIVLVQHRIHAKMQYKVGKYQVDFLLPDFFVALEIDGDRHKHKKEYDTRRDKEIKKILGDPWQIIRIPTDYLDQNAKKLPKALHEVLDYRATGHVNWRDL